MSRYSLPLVSALLVAGASALYAGPIPYGNVGHPAPLMSITATSSGPIEGYFVNSGASDYDKIALLDLTTGVFGAFHFNNHSTATGATADFGTVAAGDHLVFVMDDTSTSTFLRSDAVNADKDPHAYFTSFAGGTLDGHTFPAGLYVGFEDRLVIQGSDLDYNDDNFIFTNVAAASAVSPEPGSIALLGTGALGVFGVLRRKLSR